MTTSYNKVPILAGRCMVTSLKGIRAFAFNPELFCRDGSSLERTFLSVFLNSVQTGRPAPISAFRVVCRGRGV